MLGVAAGPDVQIEVVAQRSRGNDGVLLVLAGKLVEGIEYHAVDHRMLLDPADFVLGSLDLEEAAAMLKHFKLFAVGDFSHAIGDGGHPVAQIHLPCGNIHRIVPVVMETPAPADRHSEKQGEARKEEGSNRSIRGD